MAIDINSSIDIDNRRPIDEEDFCDLIDWHRLSSIITMQFFYSLNMKIRHIYFENMTF